MNTPRILQAHHIVKLVALLVTLWCGFHDAKAQTGDNANATPSPQRYFLAGTVSTFTGYLLANVRVDALSPAGTTQSTATTDQFGN